MGFDSIIQMTKIGELKY